MEKVYTGEHGALHANKVKQRRATYDAKNPFYAPILSFSHLYAPNLLEQSDPDLPRECLHVEIGIKDSTIKYQAGDHVAIFPENDPVEIELLANALRIPNLDVVFEMKAVDGIQPFLFIPACLFILFILLHFSQVCFGGGSNESKEIPISLSNDLSGRPYPLLGHFNTSSRSHSPTFIHGGSRPSIKSMPT